MPNSFETIEEIVDSKHSILVVWDVVNRLVENIFNKVEFLSNLQKIIVTARKAKIPIVYTSFASLPLDFISPARQYFMKKLQLSRATEKQVENPMELSLKPGEGETVIPKTTANIFIGTPFDMMMRISKRQTIIFTGIATEYGVETSARDASSRGYFPIIISDAVSSFNKSAHLHSLENMKNYHMITLSTNELCDIYKS